MVQKLCWQCEKPVRQTMTAAGTVVYLCSSCGWIGENPMQVDESSGRAVRKGEDRDVMKAVV